MALQVIQLKNTSMRPKHIVYLVPFFLNVYTIFPQIYCLKLQTLNILKYIGWPYRMVWHVLSKRLQSVTEDAAHCVKVQRRYFNIFICII